MNNSSDNLAMSTAPNDNIRPSLFNIQPCESGMADPNAPSAVEESIFRSNTVNEIEDINKNDKNN